MRAQMWTAQRQLRAALQAYNSAEDAEAMRDALLTMHAAVQEALSAYLGSQRNAPQRISALRFPALVDAVRNHTDLLRGDDRAARVLLALDGMRTQIGNPGQAPSSQQIARNATQSAKVAHRLWPRLFDEPCPVALDPAKAGLLPERLVSEAPPDAGAEDSAPPDPRPGDRTPSAGRLGYGTPGSGFGEPKGTSQGKPQAAAAEPQASGGSRALRVLGALWSDPTGMPLDGRLLLGRLLALVALLYAAQSCRRIALSSARWPRPIRYVSFMLVIVAAGLLMWALIVAWRALWQVKLQRLAAVIGIAYVLVVIVSLLTSQRSLPIGEEWLLITRQSASYVGRKAGGLVWTALDTPAALRFAYTGTRRPRRVAGMSRSDLALLAPLPANVPQRAPTPPPTPTPAAVQPTAAPPPSPTPPPPAAPTRAPGGAAAPLPLPTRTILRAPNCPYPQARLTVPRVNEVIDAAIQVQGSASIEHLDYYKFEFRRQDVEDEWHWAVSYEAPVENGVLGVWETAHLPAGTYALRLTVVNAQGNYPYPPCDVTVQIRH